jgi:hypothetical protein
MLSKNTKKTNSSYCEFSLIGNVIYQNGMYVSRLSKYEVKFFQCLFKGQEGKSEIINNIWGGAVGLNIESKYNQLICRVRKKLMRAGFPKDIIVTRPRSCTNPGVLLNKSYSSFASESTTDFSVELRVISVFQE